jgi:hypothetical protein
MDNDLQKYRKPWPLLTGVRCCELDCEYNLSHDPVHKIAACRFKQIYILEGGKCQQYKKINEGATEK